MDEKRLSGFKLFRACTQVRIRLYLESSQVPHVIAIQNQWRSLGLVNPRGVVNVRSSAPSEQWTFRVVNLGLVGSHQKFTWILPTPKHQLNSTLILTSNQATWVGSKMCVSNYIQGGRLITWPCGNLLGIILAYFNSKENNCVRPSEVYTFAFSVWPVITILFFTHPTYEYCQPRRGAETTNSSKERLAAPHISKYVILNASAFELWMKYGVIMILYFIRLLIITCHDRYRLYQPIIFSWKYAITVK